MCVVYLIDTDLSSVPFPFTATKGACVLNLSCCHLLRFNVRLSDPFSATFFFSIDFVDSFSLVVGNYF